MLVRTVRSAQPYSRRVLATNLILEMDNTRVNKVVQLCVGHSQKRLSKQLKVQHSSSRKGKQRLQVTSDAQGGRARPHFCTSVEDLPARYRVSTRMHCLALHCSLFDRRVALCSTMYTAHLSHCAGDSS